MPCRLPGIDDGGAVSTTSIEEQAAHWLVLIGGDDAAERAAARASFAAWKNEDSRHAAVAADMEAMLDQLQALRGDTNGQARPARAALDAAFSHDRKRRNGRLAATLALALLLAGPAWLTLRSYPLDYLTADLRTATGERHTFTLRDGSRVMLASGSAVNVRFDGQHRTVELVQGDILVTVAKDPAHPFIVETTHGSMRALGTRFTVARADDATTLAMLESKVAAQAANGQAPKVVQAGEQVRITRDAVGGIEAIDARTVDYAWQHGQMVVNDRPLTDVLAQLARHRSGRLQFDAAALAGIRVNAVLPLDDTDKALQLLLDNFPQLRVRRFTRYWVVVDAPAQNK